MENEYINPFDIAINKDILYDLRAGVAIPLEISDTLLSLQESGKQLADLFAKERLSSNDKSFHAPIKRNINNKSLSTKKSVVIKRDNGIKTVEVNRNIPGTLLAYSMKSGRTVDFKEALKFPLSPVPLSLSHANGIKRKCNKSDFMKMIQSTEMILETDHQGKTLIYELIAGIRSMTKIPNTFEGLIWKLVKLLPVGYKRVDLVADSYRQVSTKGSTRNERGEGTPKKILLKSVKSRTPPDFKQFLAHGDNKSTMLDLIFEYMENNKVKVLNTLKASDLYLSKENSCRHITLSSVTSVADLTTN